MNRRALFPATLPIFLLALTVSGCTQPQDTEHGHDHKHHEESLESVQLTPEAIETAGIKIVPSRRMDLRPSLEATGSVEVDESRLAHLRPLSKGLIEKVFVRRGDRVAKGQTLVEYDSIELGELVGLFLSRQAELLQARAQQELALRFWERGKQLLEAEAVALKEVELRQADYENAVATVARAEAERSAVDEKLHRFGLSEEEIQQLLSTDQSAHRTASHKTIRAPFAGVIIGYEVAAGELVDPSRELLTLADLTTVWVQADLYESDLGRIQEGQSVEVVSPAYPERVFKGRLAYIGDVLDRETRTVKVRCVFPNPERRLKLGMFVDVRIPSKRTISGVAVPEAAIQMVDGKEVVFLAEEEGRFRPLAIQRGFSSGGWTIAAGLEEGRTMAAEGSFYLKSILMRESIGHSH